MGSTRRLLPAIVAACLVLGQVFTAWADSPHGPASAPTSARSPQPGLPARLIVTADPSSTPAVPGNKIAVSVEVQDKHGRPVPVQNGDLPLHVRLNGQTNPKNLAYTPEPRIASGEASTTFEVWTTGPFDGKVLVEVQAAVPDQRHTVRGATTITFSSDRVSQVLLDRDTPLYAPVSNPKGLFVAYLADSQGAYVAKAGVELLVYAYDSAGSMDDSHDVTVNGVTTSSSHPLRIRTDRDGKVKLEVVARPVSGREYILAVYLASDEERVNGDMASLQIVNTVVSTLTARLYHVVDGRMILATSVKAGEDFFLKISARDTWGSPIEGIAQDLRLVAGDGQIAHGNPTGPADLIGAAEFDSLDWWTDAEALSNETWGDLLSQTNPQPGDYYLYLAGGKAGVQTIGAEYRPTQQRGTTNVSVKAGELAALEVDDQDGDSNQEIEVVGTGTVHGPFVIKLADIMGNQVALSYDTTVTIDLANTVLYDAAGNQIPDGGSAISFRQSESGPAVTTVSTRSTASLYFIATQTGTYQVPFRLDEGFERVVTFVVN